MGARRKRFVFVNLDACMASQGVTLTVLEQLKASFLIAVYEYLIVWVCTVLMSHVSCEKSTAFTS